MSARYCQECNETLYDCEWNTCIFGHPLIPIPEHGADSPTNGRVSGASGCSGTRSGPDNRAALTAKPRIQARVAGLNPTGHAPARSAAEGR
jgi:hypothetical protein